MNQKERLFQQHIVDYLVSQHGYQELQPAQVTDRAFHLLEHELLAFIQATQAEVYQQLVENFGSDAPREIIRALKEELTKKPLWLIFRDKLTVRGFTLELYKPKPHSNTGANQAKLYAENRYTVAQEYVYLPGSGQEVDLVIWLNGLPIIIAELKHEDGGQTVDDAIYVSYLPRELNNALYRLPFVYFAATPSQVKVATNPKKDSNFRWFNQNLQNQSSTVNEYPVEFLYKEVLAKDSIAAYLEHFLIFVEADEKIDEQGQLQKTDSFTIFPRYHQLRASRALAQNVQAHVEQHRSLGLKYLINHSAGAGKTLTIAWMAEQLDSLYTSTNEKIFDNIIILTDRTVLDDNIKGDLEKLAHLRKKINYAENASQLADHLDRNRDIIVSTIHKFNYIEDKLQQTNFQHRKVAFLIDEAHRSQDGRLAISMRNYFTESNQEEFNELEEINALNLSNQVFVAFTATTTAKTVSFFGEPFDTYSEEEAIAEGYILDVAQNILPFKTLYNLGITRELENEKKYHAGVVAKLLKTIAFEDEALIQYKSEVIVKLFEEKVAQGIGGKAKAMVVTASRRAGMTYYETIKTILEEKELPYGVLYAFSDFTDTKTNQSYTEIEVNELTTKHGGKKIQDVFKKDEYRILVVANKFQTGFDQPKLTAMFLDKPVKGINAVQTVSRLNRKHQGKEQSDILVVDFTNNAQEIFDGFNKHRKGSPYKQTEPDPNVLIELKTEILNEFVFTEDEFEAFITTYQDLAEAIKGGESDAAAVQENMIQQMRNQFVVKLPDNKQQKEYVSMLRRYTSLYYFILKFYELTEDLHRFALASSVLERRLIEQGKHSELTELMKHIELTKGAVKEQDLLTNLSVVQEPGEKTGISTGTGKTREVPKTTISDALEGIKEKFEIPDDEALVIKEICEEVSGDYIIVERITANRDDELYLKQSGKPQVRGKVKDKFIERDQIEKLVQDIYKQRGGILSLMSNAIIKAILDKTG